MVVSNIMQVEELAEETVLYAMNTEESENCFFGMQSRDSIFYKVYNEIANGSMVLGYYFALHLEDTYEILIPIG